MRISQCYPSTQSREPHKIAPLNCLSMLPLKMPFSERQNLEIEYNLGLWPRKIEKTNTLYRFATQSTVKPGRGFEWGGWVRGWVEEGGPADSSAWRLSNIRSCSRRRFFSRRRFSKEGLWPASAAWPPRPPSPLSPSGIPYATACRTVTCCRSSSSCKNGGGRGGGGGGGIA